MYSNQDFGLCSYYDEAKKPIDMLKELNYDGNNIINVYMKKAHFNLNDRVACLGYVGSQCKQVVTFDVNHIPDDDYIYLNFTSVASLIDTPPVLQKSLYACSIGILVNEVPFNRIDFFVRRNNYIYSNK